MADFEAWDEERARGIIAVHASTPGATLPILHALQDFSAAFRLWPSR